MSVKSMIKPLALAALLATGGAAQAAITVYTSLAAFNAVTANPGTDTFAGLSVVGSTPSPLFRVAGAYSYVAETFIPPAQGAAPGTPSTPGGSFFGNGTTGNPALGPNTATDHISFNSFTPGVVGFGANFYGSNIAGLFTTGDIRLTATDSSGTVTETIVNATESSFLGFVSDTGLVSVTLSAVQPSTGFLWPSADNVVLASAVPEPGTYAMLLAGLGVLGFMARRRRD